MNGGRGAEREIFFKNILLFLSIGIRIEHIQCLKLEIAPLQFVRSGCQDIKIQNSLSRAELRGLTLIQSDDDNCLMYAIGGFL